VQTLKIEPATAESGHALSNALWSFHPEISEDADGTSFVAVGLTDDRQVLEVLDAIAAFLAERNRDGTEGRIDLSLDGRRYTIAEP
jgi:hypothetical protein